jgi:DnaK suppressor protein
MKKTAGKESPKEAAKASAGKASAAKAPAAKAPPAKAPAPKPAVAKAPVAPEKPKAAAAPAKAAAPTKEKEAVKEKESPKAETSAAPKARMNKTELKFFEALLNEKKETLLQELGYLEDNTMRLSSKEGAGDLSSHAYHLADHATETQDREQAFHMASREGKYLFYIEEALDRVRNGTFGVCKKCGKIIPKARLEAVPTAKMCIECKSAQERAAGD